jgi:hypothetical protein
VRTIAEALKCNATLTTLSCDYILFPFVLAGCEWTCAHLSLFFFLYVINSNSDTQPRQQQHRRRGCMCRRRGAEEQRDADDDRVRSFTSLFYFSFSSHRRSLSAPGTRHVVLTPSLSSLLPANAHKASTATTSALRALTPSPRRSGATRRSCISSALLLPSFLTVVMGTCRPGCLFLHLF